MQVQPCGCKSKPVSMGCISDLETAMIMVDPNDPDIEQKFKEALATVKREYHERA